MKILIMVLMITLTACGKDDKSITTTTTPIKVTNTHVNTCQYKPLRAYWCRQGTCTLWFPHRQKYVVRYGVWYAGHVYKICNGVVYN